MDDDWRARLAAAVEALSTGAVAEAEARCRQLLAEHRHPWVLHALGVIELGRGQDHEAAALLDEALQRGGDEAELIAIAALASVRIGAVERGLELYERVLRAAPDHRDALCGLGALQQGLGQLDAAIDAFERCVAAHPELVEGWCNLGGGLGAAGRFDAAAEAYRRALELRPDFEPAQWGLNWALRSAGEHDAVAEAARRWAAADPEHPIAEHLVKANSGESPDSGCSAAFVERYFDAFATTYDTTLEGLDYAVPELLARELDELGIEVETAFDGGCGTGLCGHVLRPRARRLSGVDLSPAMLEHARAKQIYDELVVGELVEHLEGRPAAYDLVVLGDVLPYFGELGRLLAAVARALRPSGRLWCCFEALNQDHVAYELSSTGRYRHRSASVEAIVSGLGMQVERSRSATLRREHDRPVDGRTMLVRRSG